jgi:hypothetical protein
MSEDELTFFPHHFSAREISGDSIILDGWNEDGTGEVELSLTHATALDLIAKLSAVLAANPYNR